MLQLLKYVPTSEEMQLLSELGMETENLARADRFLFEMGKYVHAALSVVKPGWPVSLLFLLFPTFWSRALLFPTF